MARAAILAELGAVDRKDIIYLKEHYVFRPNADGTFTPIHSIERRKRFNLKNSTALETG